jgi:hypothetical protein
LLTDCCLLHDDITAAPAAVFPSALGQHGANWRRIDYLARGNDRQRAAHALLSEGGLWPALQAACQDVALVSTLAIGLDRPGSDLDIICQHPRPEDLAIRLAAQGWHGPDKGNGIWLLEQNVTGQDGQSWPLELYVTPGPVDALHGWRHLSLMAALLEHFGIPFYRAVLHLRLAQGLKGEAAICQLLALPGDPYLALLTLEGSDLGLLHWPQR